MRAPAKATLHLKRCEGAHSASVTTGTVMLSHALLALLIAAIVLLGAGTVLLVVLEVLDPLLVTIVSSAITVLGAIALTTLLLRRRRERERREIHTIRRSQMQRDRQPERYGDLSSVAEAGPGDAQRASLRRDLDDGVGAGEGAAPIPDASTIETALDAGLLTLMFEPVVEMPRNAAVAFRARPALPGADDPMPSQTSATLPAETRVKLELWAMGTALEAAEEDLRLPVQCDVSRTLLGSAEDGIGLRAILEDFPPELLMLRVPDAELDALEAGRLADAVEAGASAMIVDPNLSSYEPSDAASLAERGVGGVALRAQDGAELTGLARGLDLLAKSGATLQADGVSTPERAADLATLGFTLFTGAPFGEPRHLRDAAASVKADRETIES